MAYSVNQSWDPLRVCVVGRSFPPEYYSSIKNIKIRAVMERIARETEEDYQSLITALDKFGVEVHRTVLPNQFDNNTLSNRQFPPPMTPRDHMAMIGQQCFMPSLLGSKWNTIRGSDWPADPPLSDSEFQQLPQSIKQELSDYFNINSAYEVHDYDHSSLATINKLISEQGNSIIYDKKIDSAMVARVGRDLYFGTWSADEDKTATQKSMEELFPNYRCHVIDTNGHLDGTFSVVKPGLIVASDTVAPDVFARHFPNWEVFYSTNLGSSIADSNFLKIKEKNQGTWWVPGEEDNQDFVEYVDTYVNNWLGNIQETVIDVNMLSIDETNILCIRENQKLFDVLERHGVTPHVVNFRHHMFWDGGLHCITNDIDRQGNLKDYFPERG